MNRHEIIEHIFNTNKLESIKSKLWVFEADIDLEKLDIDISGEYVSIIVWEDGIWKNGIWKNGYFNNGEWRNGTWENGAFRGGTWKDGKWHKGYWISGYWNKGYIYDPKKNDYVFSKKNPNECEWSLSYKKASR